MKANWFADISKAESKYSPSANTPKRPQKRDGRPSGQGRYELERKAYVPYELDVRY